MDNARFGTMVMLVGLVSQIYGNYPQGQQNILAQKQLDAQLQASGSKGDVKQASPSPASGESRMTVYILQYGSSVVLVFGLLIAVGVIKFKEPDPKKLIIHYARYGKGTRLWEYRNVSQILRGHIKSGNSLDVIAGHTIFGDPFYGKPKYTLLKYSLGGVTRVLSIPEGERLTIHPSSGPPANTTVSLPVTGDAVEIVGTPTVSFAEWDGKGKRLEEPPCRHLVLQLKRVGQVDLYNCPFCQEKFTIKPFEITVSYPQVAEPVERQEGPGSK